MKKKVKKMMEIEVITCNVCNMEIDPKEERYEIVKIHGHSKTISDVCEHCFDKKIEEKIWPPDRG